MSELLRGEWRLLYRDPAAWIVLVVLAVLAGFAIHNAAAVTAEQREAQDLHVEQVAERLAEIERPVWAQHAEAPVVMPVEPTAVLALGRLRLDPNYSQVSFWIDRDTLFARYQTASPIALDAGSFDLTFLTALLVPLLIIALGYGVIASDRDNGRLRLAMSGGAPASSLAIRRIALRALTIALPVTAAAPIGAWSAGVSGEQWGAVAAWIGIAWGYMAFWWVLVGLANTIRARAEAIGVGLIVAWTFLVLVIPALSTALASSLYPPPSALANIAEARQSQIEARSRIGEEYREYMHDHPELVEPEEEDLFLRRVTMGRRIVDRETAPAAEAFAKASRAQRRVVGWAEFLTPSLAFQRIAGDLAGTGETRHRAFREQAEEFRMEFQAEQAQWALTDRRLDDADIAALDRFRFREPALGGLVIPFVFWLFVALLAGLAARRRFGRLSPLA